MKKTKKLKPVVITTNFNGVFFGWLVKSSGTTVWLKDARAAMEWSSDVGGFLGLSVGGPTKNCMIGACAGNVEIRGVTTIADCTKIAAEAWQNCEGKSK